MGVENGFEIVEKFRWSLWARVCSENNWRHLVDIHRAPEVVCMVALSPLATSEMCTCKIHGKCFVEVPSNILQRKGGKKGGKKERKGSTQTTQSTLGPP